MRTLTIASLTTQAALLATATAATLHLPSRETDPVAELHAAIAKRFQDRTSFGISRILPRGHFGVREFRPENPAEQAVVDRLAQQGYQVALYLAGHGVLTPGAPIDIADAIARRSRVQGPAFITRLAKIDELPTADALLEDSRSALIELQTGDGYDIRKGAWTVAMRPLRATNITCVQCHAVRNPSLKVGDALGVVLYVYKR